MDKAFALDQFANMVNRKSKWTPKVQTRPSYVWISDLYDAIGYDNVPIDDFKKWLWEAHQTRRIHLCRYEFMIPKSDTESLQKMARSVIEPFPGAEFHLFRVST